NGRRSSGFVGCCSAESGGSTLNGKQPFQPRDLEDAPHLPRWVKQPHVSPAVPRFTEQSDEGAEPGAVDEIDPTQIDPDLRAVCVQVVHETLAERPNGAGVNRVAKHEYPVVGLWRDAGDGLASRLGHLTPPGLLQRATTR